MDLLTLVREYIARHGLLPRGAVVVVGVSGGPDSVALLDLLRRLADELALQLHVAHLHHGLRGADADADAEYVVELARGWDLPVTVERVDVGAVAAERGLALEEAARRVRYSFLAATAQRAGASTIAVGHNADDQAETVLMHLIRGAGPTGLRGMLPLTPLSDYRLLPPVEEHPGSLGLVRPLLGVPRAEIEAYVEDRGLVPRFDRSNLDTTFFRNRLRHETLPYLAELNPRIAERLRNLAEVVRADYALLDELAWERWDDLVVAEYPDAVAFDLDGWRSLPLSLRRALLRRAAYRLRRSLRDVNFTHIQDAVEVGMSGETGSEAPLPMNLVVRVGYDTLTVADAAALHLPAGRPWLEPGTEVAVVVPGTTRLRGDWYLTVQECDEWSWEEITTNADSLVAWMRTEALVGGKARLRTRREGDVFRPHGLGGSQVRLSDFLINVKVPLRWRDHLPLLVADGSILWVVGERLSEGALVRRDEGRVLRLEFGRTEPPVAGGCDAR